MSITVWYILLIILLIFWGPAVIFVALVASGAFLAFLKNMSFVGGIVSVGAILLLLLVGAPFILLARTQTD
jgi:hypothetical protein